MPSIPPRGGTLSSTATAVDSIDSPSDRIDKPVPYLEDQPARPYQLSVAQVLAELEVDSVAGLSEGQATERLQRYGPNELEGDDGVSWVRVLVSQLVNAMVLVMIIALVVSLAIQSWIESGVIGGVIILNVVVGFLQQYTAERTMDSLRSLASPSATVTRASHTRVIPSTHLVPGDIVLLTMGDVVPADLRLLTAINFEADEALLTGESAPAAKCADAVFPPGTGVGDRANVAHASSTVTKGRAVGVVVATGMDTEIGAVARSLAGRGSARVRKVRGSARGAVRYYVVRAGSTVGRFLGVNVGTPLQRRLSQLAVVLLGIALVFAVVVAAANRFFGRRVVVIYAVSTGLCMIPASLVVVLTITFAMSTKRMAARHVIVRKLDSIEALGAVSDVCSDKTGTLTQGRMIARVVWVPEVGTWTLHGSRDPFNPHDGQLVFSASSPASSLSPIPEEKDHHDDKSEHYPESLSRLVECAALCNIASVFQEPAKPGEDENDKRAWAARGDPTEIALQVLAHRFDRGRSALLDQGYTQLAEYPFSSELKRMAVIYRRPSSNNECVALMKGAVERVLEACRTEDAMRDQVMKNVDAMAARGLRVLGFAARVWTGNVDGVEREEVERDMVFLGLSGIYDPPRPESRAAVEDCLRAGIAVRMLTGDHPSTALAIAHEVGIVRDVDMKCLPRYAVISAAEFDRMPDTEVDAMEELPRVIGRCSPETKVRMIEALHRRRRFVAMTGDGVNDSPSLSRADVGIGMGSGSDVAKNVSDIVLTDDNFASIIAAVREGRRSFDNIKSFALHLLAGNVGQAIVLMVGLAFKDQENLSVFPLSPVEVLWVVVITSGPPAMGLGMQNAAADVMRRPPHDARRGIFNAELLVDMVVYGVILGAISLSTFVVVVWGANSGDLGAGGCNESRSGCETVFRARAACFASVNMLSLLLAWEMVDLRRSLFRMRSGATRSQWMKDLWVNQILFWSVVLGFAATFPVIYIPVINDRVFLHAPISWEWAIVFVGALVFLVCVEAWKFCKRVYFRRAEARSTVHAEVSVL